MYFAVAGELKGRKQIMVNVIAVRRVTGQIAEELDTNRNNYCNPMLPVMKLKCDETYAGLDELEWQEVEVVRHGLFLPHRLPRQQSSRLWSSLWPPSSLLDQINPNLTN